MMLALVGIMLTISKKDKK
ncbi:hypothetical protein [Enterococcus mundtii]|nr:hypothetical protein [Enterococcus mundtii]